MQLVNVNNPCVWPHHHKAGMAVLSQSLETMDKKHRWQSPSLRVAPAIIIESLELQELLFALSWAEAEASKKVTKNVA